MKKQYGLSHKKLTAMLIAGILLAFCSSRVAQAETFLQTLARADKLKKEGDDEGAIAAYCVAKGMAGSPVNDARIGLARLYQKLARFSEAESEYQAMISVSGSKDLKLELAQMYSDEGKFKDAAIIYQDLVSQNPKDYTSMYHLAVCLEESDSMSSAKDYYQKVIDEAPQSSAAQASAQKLARLNKAIQAEQTSEFFPLDPELGPVGLGWWNLKKMPIHVYIDQGESTGYRPSMKNHVLNALDAWRQASGGKISFVVDMPDIQKEKAFQEAMGSASPIDRVHAGQSMPDDPIKTGIHVHWTDDLGGIAAGLAWTNVYQEHQSDKSERAHEITFGHLWLHTNCLSDGKPLPERENTANAALFQAQDRMLAEVSIHELGHCLGLTHSSNPKDIMCSGVYALNARDKVETRGLSPGDLRSLAQHYNDFEGTGMPLKVTKIGKDGAITIYHDLSKPASARIKNVSPVKLTSISSTNAPDTVPADTPEKAPPTNGASGKFADVLFDMQTRNYQKGLQKLTSILAKEPNNAMALYLRAVNSVMLHSYTEAAADYRAVIRLAPNSELATRATDGLKKLKR